MKERRKEPRFRVCDSTFAVDSCEPRRLGRLIDISRSGISFQYMENLDNPQPDTELHIFSSTHPLFLKSFPFETVYDSPSRVHPKSLLAMRRHGGRFLSLSAGQQAQLDEFISLHKVGVARSSV